MIQTLIVIQAYPTIIQKKENECVNVKYSI